MTADKESKKNVPFLVSFMAGGVSGTIGAIITCPLEVVKTRLQSSKFTGHASATSAASIGSSSLLPNYASTFSNDVIGATLRRRGPISAVAFHVRSTLQALHEIYALEGVKALWKGVGATLVGVIPSRAIYFSTYAKSKHVLTDWNNGHENSTIHLLSAASAGVATATATNPIWLIKTRMQLQQSHSAVYANSFDCLRKVIQQEGLRSLYKGLSASYLGVAEGTIQWVLYEKFKKSHQLKQQQKQADQAVEPNNWFVFFLAAAGSKLFAATLTYPHEVLRTRLREQVTSSSSPKYRGLLQAARLIVQEEGIVALYGGMTAHMMRVVPNSAIMFFCYEFLTHLYHLTENKITTTNTNTNTF